MRIGLVGHDVGACASAAAAPSATSARAAMTARRMNVLELVAVTMRFIDCLCKRGSFNLCAQDQRHPVEFTESFSWHGSAGVSASGLLQRARGGRGGRAG